MDADSADTEQIWTLLRKHVPEVTSGLIRILSITRERGTRSVLAVASNDPRVDSISAVGGHRGERVKRMASELGGERFTVIRWDESVERFVANLLAPLRLAQVSFDDARREVKVVGVQPPGPDFTDLALRSELLMNLTGWKLHLEVKQAGQQMD
jgi:N utilization substance protein A